MESQVENIGALERRFDITVSMERLQGDVDSRLKKLSKTVKLHGFRPGKVPFAMIKQMYGMQAQQEALNDAVHKEFLETVKAKNLKVVGYPRFEAKVVDTNDTQYTVSASFEVYPEIVFGELAQQNVERLEVKIEEADIDKTLEQIRKQRVIYQAAHRPAQNDDRAEIDFHGTVDGHDFAGGKAEGVRLVLGVGRFLERFEAAIVGMEVGQQKTVDVIFPEDYHSKELAGKTAHFDITLNGLEEPVLPNIDTEFVKSLGIPDGDIQKLRDNVRQDIEREVARRIRVKLKEQLMQALLNVTQFDAPVVLVNQEKERIWQDAKSDLESRGIKGDKLPFTVDSFQEKAEYRVKLGLIISELVDVHQLKPTPVQVKRVIEDAAQGYENPEQVVKWHYASEARLKEAEALALEENVTDWALNKANIIVKTITFNELMGIT